MGGEFVTQEACSRTHESINEFKRETSENFVRLHARIDKIYAAIFGVLLAIIGGIATNVMLSKMTKEANPPEIKILIDKKVITSAENGDERGNKN